MSTAFHFLCFTPLVQHDAALTALRAAHEAGARIDGVFVLGTGAVAPRSVAPSETADFLDTVLLKCLFAGQEMPPVVAVPWSYDIRPLPPSQGGLTKALTRYWGDTGRGLWRGEEDDIVGAIRDVPFSNFIQWSGAHDGFPAWRPGVLPGEGAARLTANGASLGIVVVNTVFRMAVPEATADLATCTADQLDAAVGQSYGEWAGANDLSLMVAGHTAAIPRALVSVLPRTLLLAADGDPAGPAGGRDRWLTPRLGATRQHKLLRVEITDARAPKVRDLAASSAEQPIPLPKPQRSGNGAPAGAVPRRLVPDAYDEQAALNNFYQQIGTGRMILVAVSGIHGEGGPTDTDTLTRRLTETVYGEVPDPPPTTSEIWPTALERLGPRTVDQYVADLHIDKQVFAKPAYRILQAPWRRIYDFTATDLFTSVLDHEPRAAETNTFINAKVRKPVAGNATVETVAMHGDPSAVHSLDFSVPTDDDVASRALWFRRLKAELLCHPTVFMAASPSSRALWQALALVQPQTEAESFPRFVISGPGSAADRARMRQAGLTHIQVVPHEFAVQRLLPGLEILQQGKRRLADVQVGARRGSGIKLVSSLVDSTPPGSVEFLKGQDPTWGDIKDGFAPKLSIIGRIRKCAQPGADGRHGIVLVEGRAGSGKTTALMQYAYELHQVGRTVAWIDREATDPLPNLKAQAHSMAAEAVFVDDVDIFGSLGASLLKELSNGGKALVVAAIRTTRTDELDVTFRPQLVSADEPLKDEDLGCIVDVLHQHGLPGILKQQASRPQKIDKLRELCDRSLLAAMIQVVTGRRFEEKVASEYHELNPEQVAVYSTVCVFESAIIFKKRGIEQEDLLQIVSGRSAPRASLQEAINRLVATRVLTRAADGTVRCRQRTIADTVVETVLKKYPDRLSSVIEFLMMFYAQYAAEIRDNDDPYRRIMIRLLNHSLMVSLRLTPARVRKVYDTVHELLCDNFHYWLQRGEYELERGDLGIAENHLETAQGCEGGATDHFVLTAWSAIRLRRSTVQPDDGSLRDRALEAIGVLEEVVRRHGGASPHSFSVIARRGAEWLEACESSLSADQIDDILRRILGVVEFGQRFCKDNHEFMRIADEFEPQLRRLMERNKGIPL
ncbi:P-loop NTPase [Streptomyces malaysiensis]|uniref:P-loop NTPase n=1 Tax=Streptomyces malaysiensis TaxID=92644 RepID=UPI000853147E|nr:hypothetical protein [Streptomyces sp. SPMA113]